MSMIAVLFWVCILFVAYSYGIYPLVLPLLSRLFYRPHRTDETVFPRLAVVIPAYNEELVIENKIRNVLSVDYPADRLVVWVGSDRSRDRTDEIVSNYTDPRVKLWRAPSRGGKTEVLNRLTPQTDCDVVVFTDANTMHRSDSLRKIARHFIDPSVGAVAGLVEHTPTITDEFEEQFYRIFEVYQKRCESRLHSAISAFGGFYAVRRSLFRPIRSNAYSNDDVLIPMNIIRQKHRVIFDREAVSEEDMTESIAREFARRIRIGAGNFQAFFFLLDFLNPLKGWPWFCYCSHKASRWFSPVFIFIGLLCCAVLAFVPGILLYRYLFAAGTFVAILSLAYRILPLPFLRHVFYFLSMNVALFIGLFRFLRGIKSAAWDRTDRN